MHQPFNPPAKEHDKHWVSDGNVILSAVSSSNGEPTTILFKVHKSLLSGQSEVFASMFELPQGEGNGEKEVYEGLPIVQLPDSADEVCGLLDALRDPYHLFVRTLESDTPLRIRNALLMASKYVMTSLRANLVRTFESEWPLSVESLEKMDQLFQDYLSHENRSVREEAYVFSGWPLHFVPEPASAIALAEDFDIPSILPAAYYDALRCSPRTEWDLFDFRTEEISTASDKPARWDYLSRDALRKWRRLQDVVREQTIDGFYTLRLFYSKTHCAGQPESCKREWLKLLEVVKGMKDRPQDRDFLRQLRELRVLTLASTVLCDGCEKYLLQVNLDSRDRFWAAIRSECIPC